MTFALVGTLVIALVVFAFVLEPVLRARSDRVVLDSVALPIPEDELVDADSELPDFADELPSTAEQRPVPGRVPLDRPAGSDVT